VTLPNKGSEGRVVVQVNVRVSVDRAQWRYLSGCGGTEDELKKDLIDHVFLNVDQMGGMFQEAGGKAWLLGRKP